MPRGEHKNKRMSGFQQRKAKRIKMANDQALAGSMLRFVNKPESTPLAASSNDDSQEFDTAELSAESVPLAAGASVSGELAAGVEVCELLEKLSEKSDDSDSESDPGNNDVEKDLECVVSAANYFTDISYWKVPVPDHLRVEIVKMGSETLQNKDGPFTSSSRSGESVKGSQRQLTKDWFFVVTPDGCKILRSWLMYSPISQKLYCFCCMLFVAQVTATTTKFVTGFDSWWKLNPKIHVHERSDEHIRCLEKWKTMSTNLKFNSNIDQHIIDQKEKESKKWYDMLLRLFDITLFLAKQNLAFRGHREQENASNKGNFLELVELLSRYDPILKEHLTKLKHCSSWQVSYLSPEIQNEFIDILGNHVKGKILSDIRSSKYFGIMFDSTPDASHDDQMSEVIRYVMIKDGIVEVKESFVGFFTLTGKKADDLSKDILRQLENDGLDFMKCRSQGYDNAATMSGPRGGVQALLRQQNKKAVFIGCVDHSLNLCGQHAFAENPQCVTFFGTVEAIFSFFAVSTHRWDVLLQHTNVTVKRLSQTRWSAHHDAVKPINANYDGLISAIETLSNPCENLNTRASARTLLPAVCDFTFLCYLFFWCDVLQEIDLTQKYLQTKGLSLDKVVIKLTELEIFLTTERINLVEKAIEKALSKSKEYGIAVERRIRYKTNKTCGQSSVPGPTLEEENRAGMLDCVDRFHRELQERSKSAKEVAETFEAIQTLQLLSASETEQRVSVQKLTSFYDELSEMELLLEIPRFRRHLKAAEVNFDDAKLWSALDVLQFIVKWDFQETLPNLTVSLKIFLTVCVSVASCERSFSKLKLIKSYLRTTMGQSRLNGLALLSIESECADSIDFDEVIRQFAAVKSRRVKVC